MKRLTIKRRQMLRLANQPVDPVSSPGTQKPLLMDEVTGVQTSTAGAYGDVLQQTLEASYKSYRLIRKDPTVRMARALCSAPILIGAWSVEGDDDVPDDRIQFISDNMLPLRNEIIGAALSGIKDFGWQGFEKVFEYYAGQVWLTKCKPLLQDLTQILVDRVNGSYAGLRQCNPIPVDLMLDKVMLVNMDVEGTNWFGQGVLEIVRETYNQWREANAGAARYDTKVAGSHWVVYYPMGKSNYKGKETDNYTVANDILASLESAGGVVVPRKLAGFVDELNAKPENFGWLIELKEDSGGRQPTFIDRLKYLDALKVRCYNIPERAILEGEFGTKAEAGEHKDAALTYMELVHFLLTTQINRQTVDQLLVMNYGPDAEGTVYLMPSPIADEAKTFLREIYKAIMANQQGFMEEFGTVDTDALKDRLGIPKATEIAQAGEQNDIPPDGIPPDEIKKVALSLSRLHLLPRKTRRSKR